MHAKAIPAEVFAVDLVAEIVLDRLAAVAAHRALVQPFALLPVVDGEV